MEYQLEYGNTTLFRLGHDKSGHIYLETLDTLEYGVYNIWVRGRFRDGDPNEKDVLEKKYGDFNFKIRVVVKVHW